jgi:hypothetical protein
MQSSVSHSIEQTRSADARFFYRLTLFWKMTTDQIETEMTTSRVSDELSMLISSTYQPSRNHRIGLDPQLQL